MRAYLLGCDEVLHGDAPEGSCPVRCRKALISLLSSEEQSAGEAFMTCDCQGDELCALQRRRLAVCTPDVLAAMGDVYDASTPIGCSLAELVCSADTSCLTALDFYRHHCRKLFQGLQCTQRCNNSLAILYQVEKARKLRTCTCDGTEGYNCQALMTHTERLCFPSARHFHHHQAVGSSNAAQQPRHQQQHASNAISTGGKHHSSSSSSARKPTTGGGGDLSNSGRQTISQSQYPAPSYDGTMSGSARQQPSYGHHHNNHQHQQLRTSHQQQQQQQHWQQPSSSQNAAANLCVYPLSSGSPSLVTLRRDNFSLYMFLCLTSLLLAAVLKRTLAYL